MTTINFLEETDLNEFLSDSDEEENGNDHSRDVGEEEDLDELDLWVGQGNNQHNARNNNIPFLGREDSVLPGSIQVTSGDTRNNNNYQRNALKKNGTVARKAVTSTACQTEYMNVENLPSQAKFQNQNRPATVQGARRRTQDWQKKKLRKGLRLRDNRVDDVQNVFELDSPKRLQERENVRSKLGYFGLVWYDLNVWWKITRTRRRDPIPIWRAEIKKIEGNFGNGMATFFIFMRWLFLMNVFIAVCYTSFLVIPMAIKYEYKDNGETMQWYNAIDGKGWLGNLWFFYGGYSDISGYKMELAYVLVPIAVLIILFFSTINSALKSYSNSALIHLDTKIPFSLITLASWDYSLNKPNGVRNMQHVLAHALKDAFAEEKVQASIQEQKKASKRTRVKIFFRRCLGWFLWALIVAGCFTAVWYLVDSSYSRTYLAPAVFSFINGGLPVFIIRIPRIELYKHPKTVVHITTARVFLLRVLTIFALMYGYFRETNLIEDQLPSYDLEAQTQCGNATLDASFTTLGRYNQDSCAGTRIGQEVYRLFLVDTVISIGQRLFTTIFWYYWLKRKVEMDLIQWSLHLLYRQALVWLGMCFAPILPIIAMVTNIIFFYFYVVLVRVWYRPPSTRYDQSSNLSVILVFLGITLFFMAIPLAWALTKYNPNCGPFGPCEYTSWFSGVAQWINSSSGPLQEFFAVVLNPVFIGGCILLIFVYIFMLRIRIHKLKKAIREADVEANELRADKKYLLIATQVQKDVFV